MELLKLNQILTRSATRSNIISDSTSMVTMLVAVPELVANELESEPVKVESFLSAMLMCCCRCT